MFINEVISIILPKGHGKYPTSYRFYRKINNCTVITKGLDAYSQIDIHFQGKNSYHDLASLKVTELIQISNNILNLSLYAIFLVPRVVLIGSFDKMLLRMLSG